MKNLFKLIAVIIGIVILLVGYAAINTPAKQSAENMGATSPATDLADVDADAVAANLAKALTFPTESSLAENGATSPVFEGFIAWVRETYPLVHQNLHLERINNYSLLYTWQGTDPALTPILLAGHHDVVPGGSDADRSSWEHPPYAGVIENGVIYGRGAVDDKPNVIGLLEATERLLAQGFVPQQTIYLAFGHDEEVGGPNGAKVIAETLRDRGIHLDFVLDEGGAVTDGDGIGIRQNAALIGLAEKGSVSVRLTAKNTGPTHSSMPVMQTPLGILSRAITKLEDNQMPARITTVVGGMLETLALEMDFTNRMALSNQWLFGPLIIGQMEQNPRNNSMVRTTTAPTMIEGSMKENVLPPEAWAVVNFRILPGDTVDDVIAHVRATINDDRVGIEPMGGREPTPISTRDSRGYNMIVRTINDVFEDTLAVPYLVMGGTDARHYAIVSDNQYRFAPMRLRGDQLGAVHGLNERQNVADFGNIVVWYIRFIENLNQPD